MTRRLALDLFCGAGGASMGLHRAGFDVVGVDIKRQPRYPFTFVQGDAINPPLDLSRFDLVWASPPCQKFSRAGNKSRAGGVVYPDFIAATRALLPNAGCWVIENVPEAPIRRDYLLDGTMFIGAKAIRQRAFEVSWSVPLFTHPQSRISPGLVGYRGWDCIAGNTGKKSGFPPQQATWNTSAHWRAAVGIDWMTDKELAQAIPPAYAEFIARAALGHLTSLAAA
jgi:DNA (cytosine-5)-methyltransferase 1